MKKKLLLSVVAGLSLPVFAGQPLKEGTFTDIVKDVNIVAADTKAASPAQVSAVVKAPDLVRTGPESRAEITAPDQTITRVGANSVFSFEPTSREVRLEQGSVLFYSPKGKGGGSITSGGASAAVLGSTMICSTAPDGSFKTVFLEGNKCKVTLKNGKSVTLHAGQMVVVLPGGEAFGPVLDFDVAKLCASSLLVNGFSHALASWPFIVAVIDDQQSHIAQGSSGPSTTVVNGNSLDNNTQQSATPPPANFNREQQGGAGGGAGGGPVIVVGGGPVIGGGGGAADGGGMTIPGLNGAGAAGSVIPTK